jgi:hypothetical protein
MPSDFLTDYRQRFRAFHHHRQQADYLFFSGQKETREVSFFAAEFSDLFLLSALASLRQELADLPSYRETERAALQLLLAQASHEHLTRRVQAITDEIHAYEARATIRWEGEPLSFPASAAQLRTEPSATKRHDLAARRAEVVKGAQDLRAERLEKLHAAAQEFGHETYVAMYQAWRGIAYETLATQLQAFLAQTESPYVAALSPLLVREAHVTRDEATRADLGYFLRLARFDAWFPAWQLKHVARETFSGLGIFTYKQDNLVMDDEPRPRKDARTFHFPIQVPDEIKVVFTPGAGARNYASFLHELGHAQHFAWTSRQLYPEFQLAGDGAVRDGFALLFAGLLADERWLRDLLSVAESQEFRHLLAVQKLLRIRRHAAKLRYEVELHAGQLVSAAGARYSELLSDAVRVAYDETEHLRDLEDGLATADSLRAHAFEAQLREQLKTKFGSRWWTSRKAGDYLIDLWNTGGRYSAEELARLIDLGALSFDWLAEDCLRNLAAS